MDANKRINELKPDFVKILALKNENVKIFETLDIKILQLKGIYADFIKTNKQQLFIFGLDSFHFQGKLIDIEYDDMKRLYYAITNRMYCEYFKLYKIVIDYISKTITDDKKTLDLVNINNNFPIYRDLEPFKQYDFEIIQSVHESIITLLNAINDYLLQKEQELKVYQTKNATGLNIDNFVYTFNYNNVMVREKLQMFITYMEFFHNLHTKYFKRFTTKMQLFISQINFDIRLEDSTEMNKTKRKSMLETLANDNIGKDILQNLKQSIVDEPSTPSSVNTETSVQRIFLKIDDTSHVTNDASKEKESTDNEEDVSIITTESQNNKEESIQEELIQEELIQEIKPKRQYKPRKKKE